MRRIVSVWLIDWPIAVWRRSAMRARRPASPPDPALDPQNPFALILKNSRGAAILHALNPAARRVGLGLAPAQAGPARGRTERVQDRRAPAVPQDQGERVLRIKRGVRRRGRTARPRG